MQLKTNGLIFIVGLCIGAFLFSKLAPKQQAVAVKQEQSCETVILKTTDKNGIMTEKIVFKAVQSQVVKPINKKLYGLGLKKQYDFKKQSDSFELSLSRSVNDSLDILFSYSTEQVVGVGLVLRF
jgi:hypothetical protein